MQRVYIPKSDGKQRPLDFPTVKDRVAQMAAKLVLEPIFDADFWPSSFGFRPQRSATQALVVLRLKCGREQRVIVDGDIKSFFDTIDQERRMERVARRISDRRVLRLVRQWLRAGVMEEGAVRKSTTGTPQGGVISPLLANIVLGELGELDELDELGELDELDETWAREWSHLGERVRYADDFVIACRTRRQAEEALARVRTILTTMGLALHPEKTRTVELRVRGEGFDFLECHLRSVRSHFKGQTDLFRWPRGTADGDPRTDKRTETAGDELATLDADARHPRGDRGSEPDPAGGGAPTSARGTQRGTSRGSIGTSRSASCTGCVEVAATRGEVATTGPSRVDRLAPRPLRRRLRPPQIAGHDPLPRSFACSLRTSSVSRVRENRTHGWNGGLM